MNSTFRNLLYRTFLYDRLRPLKQRIDLLVWYKRGRPTPPPSLIKQRTVMEYARRFSLETLVETGTYLGDMVYATRNSFTRIISIELDRKLYGRAKRRFSKFSHIVIEWGDSSTVLADLLGTINQPCLFWLDAHYSGGITTKGLLETPVVQELELILDHHVLGHVVLIDDARSFVGRNHYPTIRDLRGFVIGRRPDWIFEVKGDIIRVHGKTDII
jgi:hypothetical protein